MKFQGTQGKWTHDKKTDHVLDEFGDLIVDAHNSDKTGSYDALLISKAPEMLEMLENCKLMLRCTTEYDVLIKYQNFVMQIDKLIKSATVIKT